MKKVVKKAGAGRPPVYKSPRTSIAARLQAPLHDRIRKDAEAAGRSISEEIERRLESSFESPFDPRFTVVFQLLSGVFGMLDGENPGKDVRDEQYRLLTLALARALNAVAPDFHSLIFNVGDANEGVSKTYSEFANKHVKHIHEQREGFKTSRKVGEGQMKGLLQEIRKRLSQQLQDLEAELTVQTGAEELK